MSWYYDTLWINAVLDKWQAQYLLNPIIFFLEARCKIEKEFYWVIFFTMNNILGIERQPDSLDSVEGEPALPYDPVSIRFDSQGD